MAALIEKAELEGLAAAVAGLQTASGCPTQHCVTGTLATSKDIVQDE